jgi:hypothetical protein
MFTNKEEQEICCEHNDDMMTVASTSSSSSSSSLSFFVDDEERRNITSSIRSTTSHEKVQLPTTIEQGKKSRSVSFAPNVKVYSIPHINSLTETDVETIWYNDSDLKVIKVECLETALMVVEGRTLDFTTQCFRGLEYRTPEGHRRRLRNKLRSRDAVLDEQERQWDNCEDDDVDSIAVVYNEVSHSCALTAHRIGLDDEMEAMYIYQEDQQRREDCSRTLVNPTTKKSSSTSILRKHAVGILRNSSINNDNNHDKQLIDNRWGTKERS